MQSGRAHKVQQKSYANFTRTNHECIYSESVTSSKTRCKNYISFKEKMLLEENLSVQRQRMNRKNVISVVKCLQVTFLCAKSDVIPVATLFDTLSFLHSTAACSRFLWSGVEQHNLLPGVLWLHQHFIESRSQQKDGHWVGWNGVWKEEESEGVTEIQFNFLSPQRISMMMNSLTEEKRPRSNDARKTRKKKSFHVLLRLCLQQAFDDGTQDDLVTWLETWSQSNFNESLKWFLSLRYLFHFILSNNFYITM